MILSFNSALTNDKFVEVMRSIELFIAIILVNKRDCYVCVSIA